MAKTRKESPMDTTINPHPSTKATDSTVSEAELQRMRTLPAGPADPMSLISVDEAVLKRLAVLAERDHKAVIEGLKFEQRKLSARDMFARALWAYIGDKFGVRLSLTQVYDSLTYDKYYQADQEFYFTLDLRVDAPRLDGHAVIAGVSLVHDCTITSFNAAYQVTWKAYRNVSRKTDGTFDDEFFDVDYDGCQTEDFVEALTFAKTGKR